jgi:hypothetical protein
MLDIGLDTNDTNLEGVQVVSKFILFQRRPRIE